jgi:pimeloyl-ACP methyl ester carboxylesterase
VPAAEVNGLEIAYRRAGSGPPLVLVHGGASDSRDWQPQLEGLAGDLDVVAWDEPGCGNSADPAGEFGLADVADALAGLVAALELGPVFAGGLSWGGTVVLELCRRHPDVVAGLVLCDTYAGWKGSLPAAEVEARVTGFEESLAAPPEEFEAVIPGLFASDPDPEVVARMAEVMADARPEALRRMVHSIAAADLRGFLPEISVPTLLVWGEEDVRSPVETVARQFADAIPGAELVVIPRAGHMSNLEQPEEFNRAVRDFCLAQSLRR